MTIYERLICMSEWVTLVIFSRRYMTLSALAHEKAHLQGEKTCAYAMVIDILFWFDPDHCLHSYIYYRACRRKRYRNQNVHQ